MKVYIKKNREDKREDGEVIELEISNILKDDETFNVKIDLIYQEEWLKFVDEEKKKDYPALDIKSTPEYIKKKESLEKDLK